MSGKDLVEGSLGFYDFLSLDLDVRGLAGDAAVRLMDHHLGMRKDVSLALLSGREKHRTAGIGSSDAVGCDLA